ncbi:IPT/TIG domain-containing protein [Pseudanabaena yagii]|uniref:HEAT repeat domain-containing protein n=1 Tax=Pseudanabaena yagii GIHE-NHR1 TaxID=2722753 RepID=A0ABX1LZB4_9CYAN|nr:IPT/TIG domain-containing protein [Pseudanabaena yagii]NMF60865.1 hypothetical protein [Pseudanabaena yagii GIHE-NHR1]
MSEKVSKLIAQLSNINLRMQQKAAEEIQSLGIQARDAFKPLSSNLYSLGNKDSLDSLEVDLCISVLKAIIVTEDNSVVIKELVNQLVNNKSFIIQTKVAECLGEIGVNAKAAIPELESKFIDEDGNPYVRYSSKIAIARIKQIEIPINDIFFDIFQTNPINIGNIVNAPDKIIAALQSFSILGKQAEAALEQIYKLQEVLTPELKQPTKLQRGNFDLVKINTIRAIAKITNQENLTNEILEFLENANSEVRKSAALFLKEWEQFPKDVIFPLRSTTSIDANAEVRIEAFNSLITILNHDPKALICELIQALSNSDSKICIRAIWELEALGEDAREALASLRELVGIRNKWEIVRDAFNAIKTILQNNKIELQKELIANLNHPIREMKLSVIKELTTLGYMSIEYFDDLLSLSVDGQYDSILQEALKKIDIQTSSLELIQKCINLLEGDNPKLIPYKLLEDLNLLDTNKNKFLESLLKFLCGHKKISQLTLDIFDLLFLVTSDKDIDILIKNIINNDKILDEIKYCFLFFQNSLQKTFIDQWQISKKDKEFILRIIITSINRNCYSHINSINLLYIQGKCLNWLKQNFVFDEDLPTQLYRQTIQELRKLAYSEFSSRYIQDQVKEVLALNKLNDSEKSLVEIKHESKKDLLDVFQTKNLSGQIASIENLITEDPNEIIDLWIQWIIDLDGDKASLARITSDKIRTSKNAVIPLINQLEKGWQPKDEFKKKIRNKLIESIKNLDCIRVTFDDLTDSEKRKSLDKLEDWLTSIKDKPSTYSELIKAEFEKKQTDRRQLADKIIEILIQEEIDNYALQIQKRIARQLADMSDDRFFDSSSEEHDNIKEELRKHAVPALARRLPKESDIEIRESMARVLGNVGGTFAVDALAQAVVGEERTRTARQDLLAKYYLEPSKARSEEAAIILKSAVQEAKKTLWMQQLLNLASFVTGIILLTGGAFISITNEDLSKRIGGGVAGIGGLSGLMFQLVKDPLNRIQNAMSNLIQAETAFTSFIWELNLNGTYIQSQYVARGILSNEEIAQTVDRIENSMNLTMNLVSEHLNSENQGVFPRLKSLVPPISEVDKPITIYGQNLKKKDANRLIAINHRLIELESIISWNENVVKFKLPSTFSSIDSEQESVWVSLFVDGIESNVLPLQVIRSPSLPTVRSENIDV